MVQENDVVYYKEDCIIKRGIVISVPDTGIAKIYEIPSNKIRFKRISQLYKSRELCKTLSSRREKYKCSKNCPKRKK